MLVLNDNFIRTWVDTEKFPRDLFPGFRHLNYNERKVWEYSSTGWKLLYCNKTCMRNIQVVVLDQGFTRLI